MSREMLLKRPVDNPNPLPVLKRYAEVAQHRMVTENYTVRGRPERHTTIETVSEFVL